MQVKGVERWTLGGCPCYVQVRPRTPTREHQNQNLILCPGGQGSGPAHPGLSPRPGAPGSPVCSWLGAALLQAWPRPCGSLCLIFLQGHRRRISSHLNPVRCNLNLITFATILFPDEATPAALGELEF